MVGIFAIIATVRQDFFAIVAISFFAKLANNSNMRDLQDDQRRWLADQLDLRGRGARGALAAHLGVRNDAITRMTNLDGKKEAREISLSELIGMAEFFGAEPPGLTAARSKARLAQERSAAKTAQIPLLDAVSAGRLKAPSSQIPVEDVPLLSFADLGRGDFFALTVEGDSMDRISPEGSTIVVNRADRSLVSGKPYVFSNRGEVTFKLWRPEPARLAPFSTNPVHEPVYVKSRADAEKLVVGRVKRTVLDF
jgi:SOS-response transcriptional repressor LexA